MNWRSLIPKNEVISHPWTGGREIIHNDRWFFIDSRLPPEHGWHRFAVNARKAQWCNSTEAPVNLKITDRGYLVGDKLINDSINANWSSVHMWANSSKVLLLENGLPKFTRIACHRHEDGRLILAQVEFPLGPEDEANAALLSGTYTTIKSALPSLDAALKIELWVKEEEKRELAEQEQIRVNQQIHQRRQNFEFRLIDALTPVGATLLDHYAGYLPFEEVVQFKFRRRSFECVINKNTLQITDAGICLRNHATGFVGDTLFTLESLPSVINEAMNTDKLVIYRHIDFDYEDDD